MIETMSPPARRIIALCILILLALFAAVGIVAPLARALSETSERLGEARFQLARLEALAQRPVPNPGRKLPSGLFLRAANPTLASSAFDALLNASAGRNGIAITGVNITPDGPSGKRLQASFSASGPEVNVIRFIQELEQGQPLVRFRTWRLAPAEGDKPELRLDAIALLVWSNAP
jgi:type II secretory pathway component PulM